MNLTRMMAAAAAVVISIGASTANAWHIIGKVVCDENQTKLVDAGDRPLAGIAVVVRNLEGIWVVNTQTDAEGNFFATASDVPDDYRVFIDLSTAPTGAT